VRVFTDKILEDQMGKRIFLIFMVSFMCVSPVFSDSFNDELQKFLIQKQETPQERFSQDNLMLDIYVQGQEKPNGYVIPRITAFMFADYLYTQHSFAQTVEFCQVAIKADPNEGYFYCRMGDAYEASGKIEEAIVAYEKAIETAPQYSFPYFRLWGIYTFDKNDSIKAESYWNKFNAALAEPSKISDDREKELIIKDLFSIGDYFLNEARDFDKSLKFFNMILKLNPDHERTKLNIAMSNINQSIKLKDKNLFENTVKDVGEIAEKSQDAEVKSFVEQFLQQQAKEIRENNFSK